MAPCRVLVVDDNTDIHRDFKRIVDTVDNAAAWSRLASDPLAEPASGRAEPQFELSFAASGEAAVNAVRSAVTLKRPFHVAIVDMRMPGLDGLATVEKLWTLQSDLQVAFSSAYMDYSWNSVIARLKRPGLRLVPKPWTASEIIAVLHEMRDRVRRTPPSSRNSYI